MIMDAENMTPAKFADTLQIGRPVISHILNGRNNPSLDVITQVLSNMPYINADWLITGVGNMYKPESENITSSASTTYSEKQKTISSQSLFDQDLFSQNSENPPAPVDENEYRKENELNLPQNNIQKIVNERIIYREKPDKKISQIIIYYSDNTYEIFNAGK